MDQRLAVELNFEMIQRVNDFCYERVLSTKHNDTKLSSTEETQFKNCFTKYFAAT